jgi:pyruvate/2-oxoglutarate/acetoin dehydrogenase E1 component
MRNITFREAVNEALDEALASDPRVFIAGEDIGILGGVLAATKGLLDKYGPDRVIDTPISEAALGGLGVGSAILGMRPIIEIMYMDFISVCMDEIINQAAKLRYMFGGQMKVPVVFRMSGGGSRHTAAHHSQCQEALLNHIPGIKIVFPSTPEDVKGLLISAVADNDPIVFIEHKALYNTKGNVPDGSFSIPLGKAKIVREGSDVTIVTWGLMLAVCEKAADQLAQNGIDAEVIDLRTIKPMDYEAIEKSLKKTNKLVIVHEAVKRNGVGAEIAAKAASDWLYDLDAPVVRVTAPNAPVPFSPPLEEQGFLPTPEKVILAVEKVFAGRKEYR